MAHLGVGVVTTLPSDLVILRGDEALLEVLLLLEALNALHCGRSRDGKLMQSI